jgi:hypothetical protein
MCDATCCCSALQERNAFVKLVLFATLVLSFCIRVLFSGQHLTPGGVTDELPVVVADSHSKTPTYYCF